MSAIGIDLGTTYSCVAVYQNGKVRVITNPEGYLTTPSEVAFTDRERLVGNAAKNQGAVNPKNTVFDVKRLIGRKFDDPELQADLKNFPFKVISKNSNPVIEVEFKKDRKQFTPEQISSMVLQKMKDTAERYLGHEVKKAVVTVPAYFNDGQRQATKDAAKIAGLEVLRIINEPTAAALAFGLDKDTSKTQKVLIFDFGGGTFDVSIVTILPDYKFEVNATTGDTHFGGSDFDQRMLQHFAKEFNKKHNVDITSNPRSMRRLRSACEVAKRSLSVNVEEIVIVDALFDGIDFTSKITRVKFEELCSDMFLKTLDPVKKALSDAKLRISDIDEVVLVGGSTRIPKVKKVLQQFFNGKPLNSSINPDEAVAYGAAAQAALLSGEKPNSFGKLLLQDVTPMSLGIETIGDVMSFVVGKNAHIPVKKTRPFYTVCDYQKSIKFPVYEGENPVASRNHKLGEFTLANIKSLPQGQEKYDVTFDLTADGILEVTAVERSTGKKASVIIDKGRLGEKEIKNMAEEAKNFEKEDKVYLECKKSLEKLQDYVYKIKDVIDEKAGSLSESDTERMLNAWRNEYNWLEENEDADKETIDARYEAIKRICGPID